MLLAFCYKTLMAGMQLMNPGLRNGMEFLTWFSWKRLIRLSCDDAVACCSSGQTANRRVIYRPEGPRRVDWALHWGSGVCCACQCQQEPRGCAERAPFMACCRTFPAEASLLPSAQWCPFMDGLSISAAPSLLRYSVAPTGQSESDHLSDWMTAYCHFASAYEKYTEHVNQASNARGRSADGRPDFKTFTPVRFGCERLSVREYKKENLWWNGLLKKE